ncbi:MAG TPA: polysaccharide deacetylase family protein [Kutzneria sp.]
MTRRISRRAAFGIAATTALAGCAGPPTAAPSPSTITRSTTTTPPVTTTTTGVPGGPAVEVVRASSGRPEVALTFHGDGPLAITRQVLALLAKSNAKITVFAVGTWLTSTPDGARMVRDGGHELGNHTWSHPDLERYQPGPMLTEIERCRDALSTVAGTPGTFFRQSQGQHATARELAAAGTAGYTRTLSYDVDSLDWTDPGAAAIRRAAATVTAGSVVSMHLGHAGTVQALPAILTDLADRGLTPVTATELLR